MKKKILGATIGSCIHVAGLQNFFKIAQEQKYDTLFVGTAVPAPDLIRAIEKHKPHIVALGYRLTPAKAGKLFREIKNGIRNKKIRNVKFIFGGTPPVCEIAGNSGLFEKVFKGTESISDVRDYLYGLSTSEKSVPEADPLRRGRLASGGKERRADTTRSFITGAFSASYIKASKTDSNTLAERIKQKYPYPLLRHHFGLPILKETLKGAKAIAQSGVLDVLSIGPDQNAQEHFFHPEQMNHKQDGAGGVPLRRPQDLKAIYKATRTGNFPLVRCYAGTRDLIKWAEMSVKNINIAWGAIPLCWYSILDGRSNREMIPAITENQQTIKWYARKRIPVEVNESHQWSLRNAHDSLAVATAFLGAYNARKLGVRCYVSQYMFNTPPGISPKMDLAKMLAKKHLIEGLQGRNFTVFNQVRAGLSSFSSDLDIAKGQLSASTVLALALKPHIVHVVGYSEGDHAVNSEELIESCKIVHGVIRNSLNDFPNLSIDNEVKKRKTELIKEANVLLEAINELGGRSKKDSWTDSETLAKAIEIGLLDAPHLSGTVQHLSFGWVLDTAHYTRL